MVINKEVIEAVMINLETSFVRALDAAPPTNLSPISMEVGATGKTKRIPMGALLATIKEFVGERVHEHIGAYLESVAVRKFEGTVDVDEDDIEDDELGMYQPTVQSLAEEANLQWEDLVVEAVDTRGWDTDYPLFDGYPLFSASHTWKGGKYTTAQANCGILDLDEDAFYAAEAAMLAYRRPNGGLFKSRPSHILYAPGLQSTVDGLFNAPTGASGASNKLYNRIPKANQILVPGFTAGHWMLCDASRAVKPVLRIVRRAPRFTAVTDPKSGGAVFEKMVYSFGIDMRRSVAAPAWWLWWGSDGSET